MLKTKDNEFMEQLLTGIVYIKKNLSIEIQAYESGTNFYIDIHLNPAYPNKVGNKISLKLTCNVDYIYFDDLIGNGYHTDYQNKGYGRLIVNTGIQVLNKLFNGNKKIMAELSDSGDPKDDPIAHKECKKRRFYFWTSFGFIPNCALNPPDDIPGLITVETTLSKMRVVESRPLNNSNFFTTFIDVNHFWNAKGSPKLLKYYVDKMSEIDWDILNLTGSPTKKEIIAEKRRKDCIIGIGNLFCFFASLIIAIHFLNMGMGFAKMVGAFIFSFFSFYLPFNIINASLLKDRKRELRSECIRNRNTYISDIEKVNVGFLWRFECLRNYSPYLNKQEDAFKDAKQSCDYACLEDGPYVEMLKNINQTLNDLKKNGEIKSLIIP